MYKNPLIFGYCLILIFSILTGTCSARDESFTLPAFQPEVFIPEGELAEKAKKDTYLPFVSNGYLYVFSMVHKAPIWRIFIGGDLQKPFIVLNDRIYFYDVYNRVYGVVINSSEIEWVTQIDGEIEGALIYHESYLLAGTQNGDVFLIDLESGSIIRKYSFNSELSTGVYLYQNIVILPFRNGRIVGYDIFSGDKLWEFSADGIIVSPPVIKYGVIYFGAWDENFYAIDIFNGKLIWSTYIGENIARDFLVFDENIVLFFSRGEVITLSRKTGEIIWVKYYRNVEFSYNYFRGNDKFFIFLPEVVAIDPSDGSILYRYEDRAFEMYKDALFDMMIEATEPLTEEKKARLLRDVYFNVSSYPLLPPLRYDELYTYFVAEDSYLYIFDMKKEFFVLKYSLE